MQFSLLAVLLMLASVAVGCTKSTSNSAQFSSTTSTSLVDVSAATPQTMPYCHSWKPDFTGEKVLIARETVFINASSQQVFQRLCQRQALLVMLPRVQHVEVIMDWGNMHLWRITHALGIFRGSYVLRMQCIQDNKSSYLIRFRVDTRYERDVKDGWGYIRVLQVSSSQSRLDYQARAVLYPGVVRWLFSPRIEKAMGVVASRARDHVHQELSQQFQP